MTQQRLIAVGDIHGTYDKLMHLMEKLPWSPDSQDRLVFLGDYIDRGPDSFKVVDYLVKLKKEAKDNLILLCGNHEQMFLDFISGQGEIILDANGVSSTIRDYTGRPDPFPVTHLEFYQNLLHCYETKDFIFVHAGLRPEVPVAEQTVEDMLWIRGEFLNTEYDFGKTVVFGHTPLKKPFIEAKRLGIDTGAVYGGPLTAIVLPQRELIQQE